MAPLDRRAMRKVVLFAAGACKVSLVAAQMQFEIPPEMLAGLMGGQMGGGGGKRKDVTQWPKTENSEIEPEYEWIINTEWKGKTSTYTLMRDGTVESSLKECEPEGNCLWAANSDKVIINTPTLKVTKFTIEGYKTVDKKKLLNKDEKELTKIKLQAVKAGKTGKKSLLEFSKLVSSDEAENIIASDLYGLLDVTEDATSAAIKKEFRRLSIQNHPDKGGDPEAFRELREAYEIISDADKSRYYKLGGMQLVKNVELAYKEVESQIAQLDAKLTQIPKNHPQRQMAEMQIAQQKQQMESDTSKHSIEKKFRDEDIEIMVPISAMELYNGVASKDYTFTRKVLCRGCRADWDAEKCKDCGRCPPEKVQVPKYGNTPFGKQVIAMKEKEQESRERCREVPVTVSALKVPKGAKPGHVLKYVSDMGHQTAGKLPGRVVLKVQHGSPTDLYTIAETDLHTVLSIQLDQALFGFSASWNHLGDQKVTVTRTRATQPDEVVKFKKKGLLGTGGARGDLYVRLAIELPAADGKKSLTLAAPAAAEIAAPKLSREAAVEVRDGAAWRRWVQREEPKRGEEKAGAEGKTEL